MFTIQIVIQSIMPDNTAKIWVFHGFLEFHFPPETEN
jgi:hypothetical protein